MREAIRMINRVIRVEDVFSTATDALVVTSPIQDDRGREGWLVFQLIGHHIVHVDFQDTDGLAKEFTQFYETHPDAHHICYGTAESSCDKPTGYGPGIGRALTCPLTSVSHGAYS